MAKQGQKLTDELKEQIRAHLVLSDNLRETARHFDVSPNTVKNIRDEKKDEFTQLRTDKKQQMIHKIWDSLVDAADLGHSMIKEAKNGQRDIPLNQVSTFYGTMYDKMALMSGENTQNIGVSGDIDITQLSPEDRRARIDELNRRRGNGTHSTT